MNTHKHVHMFLYMHRSKHRHKQRLKQYVTLVGCDQTRSHVVYVKKLGVKLYPYIY